jgi:hypothetical protein
MERVGERSAIVISSFRGPGNSLYRVYELALLNESTVPKMRRNLPWMVLPLILVASFLFYPGAVTEAHAALTPTVCLRDPNSSAVLSGNPCSGTAVFDGPVPGTGQTSPTQIRIGVYINSSAALDGFDITLLTNHTVLRPFGVDTTGTVVPGSTSVIVECIGGKNITNVACASGDTSDTIHFALESYNVLTTAPTTGLLFTAIYNITGTSIASGISVGFATGCVATSDNPVCVTITNGTTTPNTESVQTATFNNHTTPPWVAVSSNSTSLTFLSGSSVGNHAGLTATAKNGWPGSSADLVSFSAQTSSTSVTTSFSPPSCSTSGTSCVVVMSVNAPAGNYSVTALGEYLLTDPNFAGQTDTLLGPVSLQLTVRDFSQTASPGIISFNTGGSGTSTIQLTSLNRFAGTVSLSLGCSRSSQTAPSGGGGGSRPVEMLPPSSCPPATISPASVTLSAGSVASSTLTVSSPSYLGNYTYIVSGVSGSSSVHANTITTFVNDFNVTASSSGISINQAHSSTVTVTLQSQNKFAGTVTLSASVYPSGLVVSFNPASVNLAARGSANSVMNITVPSGTVPGNYVVEIVASGGGIVHTFQVIVTVKLPGYTGVLFTFLSQPGVSALFAAGLIGMAVPSTWIIHRRRSRRAQSRWQMLKG